MTLNNPKLDVVNISAYAKFGQNSLKLSQDIEWKRKYYGRLDNLDTSYMGVIIIAIIILKFVLWFSYLGMCP